MLNVQHSTTKRLNSKKSLYPSLEQGQQFQNKRNSAKQNYSNQTVKEGFNNLNGNSLTQESQTVIENNNYSNKQQTIQQLKQEYDDTLQQYQTLIQNVMGNVDKYMERTNPNNPYLNKVVSFTTGEICYVTNKGVVKYIPSTEIWNSLNISQKVQVPLNIPWNNTYNTPGTSIDTIPPLISGTPVTNGQSLGNEGNNIFVNQFLPQSNTPNYLGCYAGNKNNNNVSFIGTSPPALNTPTIQNGNFAQPVLKNNSYTYITSANEVPGWYFGGACLLNDSSSWGFSQPYPGGNQCVAIQNQTYIYSTLTLETGVTYTLTCSTCSRDCCNSTNSGNPINVQLYTTANAFISTLETITPTQLNVWQNQSFTFTVPTSQMYNLYFTGTNTNGDQSTAMTNVQLSSSNSNTGTYSFNDCKQSAITMGYRYFGLQNVNTNTGLGYCAVSNSEPSIAQYGNSTVPSSSVTLWSSNTSNQTGNSAVLNTTGSLQVVNSTGQAVYNSPSSEANPSNYLGCYTDKSSRAMSTSYNNGSATYDLSGCMQAALNGNYQYFGLQNSTTGNNAQCFLSNDLASSTKYGPATNCTQLTDGTWSGGGWSNAIYNATLPQSNYYLILQDDGNMCIYRGSGPNDNQGLIWSTNTNGKNQSANPSMSAQNSTYGQNWIASGTTLAPGDFVGSTKGDTALVMQTDGNLVLYTYQMTTNCQKMSDGNMGGGVGANAMYDIGITAVPNNMGQLAYIDADSNLYTYPSNNVAYTNTYSKLANSNTNGNDLSNGSTMNSSVSSCQNTCDQNDDCAGFVFDASNSICYQKNYGMYPFGNGAIENSETMDLYFKNRIPSKPPHGVSQQTNQIDTITYQSYKKKGQVKNEYGLPHMTTTQKQELNQLQTKMDLLSNSISKLTGDFQKGAMNAEQQVKKNITGIQEYIDDIKKTNYKINNISNNGNIENILNDSDIVVLQKNYQYLLWSILAAGTVIISLSLTSNRS